MGLQSSKTIRTRKLASACPINNILINWLFDLWLKKLYGYMHSYNNTVVWSQKIYNSKQTKSSKTRIEINGTDCSLVAMVLSPYCVSLFKIYSNKCGISKLRFRTRFSKCSCQTIPILYDINPACFTLVRTNIKHEHIHATSRRDKLSSIWIVALWTIKHLWIELDCTIIRNYSSIFRNSISERYIQWCWKKNQRPNTFWKNTCYLNINVEKKTELLLQYFLQIFLRIVSNMF